MAGLGGLASRLKPRRIAADLRGVTMASLANDPGGTRRVLVAVDGRRRTIRLGRMPKKQAESIVRHVEALAASRIDGSAPPEQTSRWLAGIADRLRERLVKAGLAEPAAEPVAEAVVSVGRVACRFIRQKRARLKPRTLANYRRSFRSFLSHVRWTTAAEAITAGDAEAFRDALLERGLSEATVRRHCADAAILLGYAVKHRVIHSNPFYELSRESMPLKTPPTKRTAEISDETFAAVLSQVHDPEMRFVLCASRYGGMRVPSEPPLLTWSDIDWERRRITVTAPKTERHEGRDKRVIPMFDELVEPLEALFDQASEGELYVLPTFRNRADNYAGQVLSSAIKRAGIEPWPRRFHNMRVTRQTELEADFPTHVVCAWLGNSPEVARASYLKVRDGDFDRAIGVAQKAAQQAPAASGFESQAAGVVG